MWQIARASGFDIPHSFCTSTYVHKMLWITPFRKTQQVGKWRNRLGHDKGDNAAIYNKCHVNSAKNIRNSLQDSN